MDFTPSEKARDFTQRLHTFIAQEIEPIEAEYLAENRLINSGVDWRCWQVPSCIEDLKQKARDAGLWNLFLPDETLGAGLSLLDYAPLAEKMGRIPWCAEVFNCNAPDTGNMEVLWHYGTEQQKTRWLTPLLAGSVRSVFCMTEPDVASSDARNIAASITEEGDELVLNGRKWWSTGIGHPKADVAIFMGVSNPDARAHEQHSMVIVPLDTPGIRIERMLPTFGEYDPPYGHGEVVFDQVRVPRENLLVGHGQGFAIAQGRLGPGRVHHCMRAIGAAERALQLMVQRGSRRTAFGKPLIALDGNREKLANARMAIDQARLLTLFTAWKIQHQGVRQAIAEVSAIKVVVPNMLQQVVDQSIQLHGGAGLSHDTVLSDLFLMARALRFADGPDEVHRSVIAKQELKRQQEGV